MELEAKYMIQRSILRQAQQLKPLTRLVALCILDYRNDNKKKSRYGQCNPGQKRVATDLGISERAVRGAIAELEETGVIQTRRTGSSSEFVFMPISSLNTLSESTCLSDRNQRAARKGRKTRARIAAEPMQADDTAQVTPAAQVEPQRELTQAELSLGRYTAVALSKWGELE